MMIKKASASAGIMLLSQPVLAANGQLTARDMFMQADWVVKSVMLILVAASVLCWGIFIAKKRQLNLALKRSQQLLAESREAARLESLVRTRQPESGLIDQTMQEYAWGQKHASSHDGIKERTSQRLLAYSNELMDATSSGTSVLASIGSTAPCIGLYGTVWGIMNSFVGIAATKTTNLAVVAPGIAEALLATAAGLVAAIPAVLIYKHFSRALARYRKSLQAISTQLMVLLGRQLELVDTDAKAKG